MTDAPRPPAQNPRSAPPADFELNLERRLAAITADADGNMLERSMATLLRLVREQLQLEAVFVGEVVDGHRIFRFIDAAREPSLIERGQSHPMEQTVCQRILDGRIPALVGDLRAVRVAQGLSPMHDVLGAHVGVPVRFSDGRLYGMLCGFCFDARGDLDERDLRRLEIAARAAARLLAHADGVMPPV